jgi:N-acetylmuramic acid 6-phosphate etherase
MKPQRSVSRQRPAVLGIRKRYAPGKQTDAKAFDSIANLGTEQANKTDRPLDTLNSLEIVQRIHAQDAAVAGAVAKELPQIAKAVDAAVAALRRGGRLIYVGAGTSGRLGVLDAAECPPTFGIPPDKIQAVIAGGSRALLRASESAEDDAAQGERDLRAKKVGPRDVIVGISASGRTPYTLGALQYARLRGATTVGISCNPGSPLEKAAHIGISPSTGPEVLSGSTRMKAGLAQKMILHTISTATMTRLGHVYQNLMVGVRPTNEKLLARACAIVSRISDASLEASARALNASGNDVRTAIIMLAKGLTRQAATRELKKHAGNLREIL